MRILFLPAFAALLTLAACSNPQTDASQDSWDPFPGALAQTQSRNMVSEITGRTYQISVALPRGYYDSDESYPVLYSVDANGEFGTVVETARTMTYEDLIPHLIIVGIGYPVGLFFDASGKRTLDLSPTADPEGLAQEAEDYPEWPVADGSGGAPDFLRFIQEELIPLIDDEFRTDPSDRGLFGHSFGGLFGTFVLLNGHDTFQKFIIGSPSYWWDNDVSFDLEEDFSLNNDSLPARAFFSVGEYEDLPAEADTVIWGHMVKDLQRYVDTLNARAYEGFEFQHHVFPDEWHTSVIPATISKGLRYIYGD